MNMPSTAIGLGVAKLIRSFAGRRIRCPARKSVNRASYPCRASLFPPVRCTIVTVEVLGERQLRPGEIPMFCPGCGTQLAVRGEPAEHVA